MAILDVKTMIKNHLQVGNFPLPGQVAGGYAILEQNIKQWSGLAEPAATA